MDDHGIKCPRHGDDIMSFTPFGCRHLEKIQYRNPDMNLSILRRWLELEEE